MSSYCRKCAYDPKKRTGEGVCSFSFFYWNFLARYEDCLKSNGRMANIHRTWERFGKEEKLSIRATAQGFSESP